MTHWDLARGAAKRGAVQKLDEFAGLVRELQRKEINTVLEIGTFRGGTLWAWSQLATDDALLVSVDMCGSEIDGPVTPIERERLSRHHRASQRLELLEADSHLPGTLEAVTGLLEGRSVDLLFIDGDHSYEGVKQDFEMYSPLAVGGVCVFHDILEHPVPWCKVDEFWNEIRHEFPSKEWIGDKALPGQAHSQWGGIGLLYL